MLGELYDFPAGTMAIGRLDENSEGLLLLTTDGKMSHELLSKKYDKEYYVLVDGLPSEPQLQLLRQGVSISVKGEPYTTLPAIVRAIADPKLPAGLRVRADRHGPSSWVSITINEGKYRQIRKMTAAVGLPTLRLVRVRIADILLEDMQPCEVRQVEKLIRT